MTRAALALVLLLVVAAPIVQAGDGPEALIARLVDGDPAEQDRAATALMRWGPEVTPAVLRALPTLRARPARRAFEVLLELGAPETLPALLEAARDARAERRRLAAWLLSTFAEDPQAQGALLLLAQDPEPGTAWQALRTLRDTTPAGAWAPLAELVALGRVPAHPAREALRALTRADLLEPRPAPTKVAAAR